MIFASTEPMNIDPEPELNPDGSRHAMGYGSPTYGPGVFGQILERIRWSPRPEYDVPRAHDLNPLLPPVREALDTFSDTATHRDRWHEVAEWADSLDDSAGTAEHVEHAFKVLSRWLVVYR